MLSHLSIRCASFRISAPLNPFQQSIVGFDELMKVQAGHANVSVLIRIDFKLKSLSFLGGCGLT